MKNRCFPRYRPFGTFRFVLAMMVLLQHGLLMLKPQDRGAFYDLELGAVAVAVFFALSGFIVAEAISTCYSGRPVAFLVNRTLRILPLYFASLGLAILTNELFFARGWLEPILGTLQGSPTAPRVILAAFLEIIPGLPAQRISGQTFSFIPFAWTLRVEFAFYLAATLACAIQASPPKQGGPSESSLRLQYSTALLAASAGALLIVVIHFSAYPGQGPTQFVNVPFFAFGLSCFLHRECLSRNCVVGFALSMVPVLTMFPLCGESGHPVIAVQIPLLCLLLGLLFVLSRRKGMNDTLRKWDRILGSLSYPLYVSHGVVLTLLGNLFRWRGPGLYAITVVVSIGLAVLLEHVVERPLAKLRTQVRGVAL